MTKKTKPKPKKRTRKNQKESESDKLKEKVDVAMLSLGFVNWVVHAETKDGTFHLVRMPYPQLLKLRARLDKLILENTE